MRPIQLKLTAFGPYKDTEVINFSELGDHNLFVISGNTGAGKTTIFDGICFALYGTASGQDRDHHTMLRSHFADDDVHTSVQLIFEIHGRTFRILRQLGHVKKGNKTRTGERYEFFERINDQEVPFVDRQIVSEINQKVEELLGLTQDQFKQIVMLPQGEFLKLLTSETENKEAILRRLFKTEHYKHMSELLRERQKDMEQAYERELQVQENYIHHITASLPKRENSVVFTVLDEEHYNINQVISGLEEEKDYYAEKIETDEKAYDEAYKAHDLKQTELHRAKAMNERFREWDEKKTKLKELQEQKPLFTEKAKQLEAAERARHIEPYEQLVLQWRTDEKKKIAAVKIAERHAKEAEDTLMTVQETYDQEKDKKGMREDIGKKLNHFEQFLPTVKDIDNQKKHLRELDTYVKQNHKALSDIDVMFREKKKQADELAKTIRTCETTVIEEPVMQEQLTTMREQARVLKKLLELQEEQKTINKNLMIREKAYHEAKSLYEAQEKQWLNSQAYVLATHLHEGKACPVCGSTHHPEKAERDEDVVTREQLDITKKKLDQKDELYRNALADQKINEKQLKDKAEEVKQYDIQPEHASKSMEVLVEKGKKLSEDVEKLKKAREKLHTMRRTEDKIKEDLKQLEVNKEKLEQEYQKHKSTFDAQKAVFNERLRTIPENVRELPQLEKQINNIKLEKQALEQAWEQAQKRLTAAKEKQTKAVSSVEHAHKQLKETITRKKDAEMKFQETLKSASFESERDYQDAKMLPIEREQLKKDIEQFNQQFRTTNEQVNELQKLLQDKERVDLTELQEQLDELKKASEQALSVLQASITYCEEAKKLKTAIQSAQQRVLEREKQLGMITDLYDVVRGQNRQRISFERFLQIEYLEQIIHAANQRLQHLSNGQFMLMRSDRQEAYGRQSGLAFDVYDAYTGQTRDVKTLSGGEKFNASLCLALGMSDVIQSFQGNISIKTMFIDEGFGTLDEDSLNKSIDTLIDLQASGRMIGVISHVQELKTIFPAVLEVSKTREGYSQTKFVVK